MDNDLDQRIVIATPRLAPAIDSAAAHRGTTPLPGHAAAWLQLLWVASEADEYRKAVYSLP